MNVSSEVYGKYLESAEALVRNGYYPWDTDIHELANKIIESRIKVIRDERIGKINLTTDKKSV